MNNNLKFKRQQFGFTMIEVMFGASLISLVSFGLVRSLDVSARFTKEAQISAALQILVENKISEIEQVNPLDLEEENYDSNETGLPFSTLPGITFNRITDVIVNEDSSKTLNVSVACTNPVFAKALSKTILIAGW